MTRAMADSMTGACAETSLCPRLRRSSRVSAEVAFRTHANVGPQGHHGRERVGRGDADDPSWDVCSGTVSGRRGPLACSVEEVGVVGDDCLEER